MAEEDQPGTELPSNAKETETTELISAAPSDSAAIGKSPALVEEADNLATKDGGVHLPGENRLAPRGVNAIKQGTSPLSATPPNARVDGKSDSQSGGCKLATDMPPAEDSPGGEGALKESVAETAKNPKLPIAKQKPDPSSEPSSPPRPVSANITLDGQETPTQGGSAANAKPVANAGQDKAAPAANLVRGTNSESGASTCDSGQFQAAKELRASLQIYRRQYSRARNAWRIFSLLALHIFVLSSVSAVFLHWAKLDTYSSLQKEGQRADLVFALIIVAGVTFFLFLEYLRNWSKYRLSVNKIDELVVDVTNAVEVDKVRRDLKSVIANNPKFFRLKD